MDTEIHKQIILFQNVIKNSKHLSIEWKVKTLFK